LEKVSSPQNPLYKHFKKLSTNKKYRYEQKSFLAFGKKVISELSEISPPINLVSTKEGSAPTIFKESLVKDLSGQPAPDGVFAEFSMPDIKPLKTPFLVLDGLQDPGNLGTLLRSVLAFNWGSVIFLPGCVDPFSPKVIQASRGAIASIPFRFFSADELQLCLKQNSLSLYIADCEGVSIKNLLPSRECALLLGNEGQGIITNIEGKKVTIPINSSCESLNVAIAGSIIMHHLKPYE
jgi:RNA methyltransferase, TrmH family